MSAAGGTNLEMTFLHVHIVGNIDRFYLDSSVTNKDYFFTRRFGQIRGRCCSVHHPRFILTAQLKMSHLGLVHLAYSIRSGYSCRSKATSRHRSCRLGDPCLFAVSHVFAVRVAWSWSLSCPLSSSCKPWQVALITLASGSVERSLFIWRCETLSVTFSSSSSRGCLRSQHVLASQDTPSLCVLLQLSFSSPSCRQSQLEFAFQSLMCPYVLLGTFLGF